MTNHEQETIPAHKAHSLERRAKTLSRVESMRRYKLEQLSLKDPNIILIDEGRDSLLIHEEPLKIRDGKITTKRTIPRLSAEVRANFPDVDRSPDYVKWILSIGKIPPEKLGAIAEGIVWELAEKKYPHPVTQFMTGVKKLAEGMARNLEKEKSLPNAAWKYAIATFAILKLARTTKADIDCQIYAETTGLDILQQNRRGWVESDSALGYNLHTIQAIDDEINKTGLFPSNDFMIDHIREMHMPPTMPWEQKT